MAATIEVRGVRKSFGPTLALDGMSFTVRPGRVTGFIGPNGAGKTTTMRVILGLDAPDEGSALVGGRRYATLRRPLTQLGSLLDAAALQPSRSGRNHLLWHAHRLRLRRRHALDPGGQRQPGRAACGGAGWPVRDLPRVGERRGQRPQRGHRHLRPPQHARHPVRWRVARRERRGGRAAGVVAGRVPPGWCRFYGDRFWRHRTDRARVGAPRQACRRRPRRRVRRADRGDRGDRGGRDVHHRRVPPRPDPHHVRRRDA